MAGGAVREPGERLGTAGPAGGGGAGGPGALGGEPGLPGPQPARLDRPLPGDRRRSGLSAQVDRQRLFPVPVHREPGPKRPNSYDWLLPQALPVRCPGCVYKRTHLLIG